MNGLQLAALLISAAAYPFYWYDAFKRNRSLNPVIWGIFLLVDGLILAAQVVNHHVATPMVVYCGGMVITLGIALIRGKREFDRQEGYVLALAVCAMFAWGATDALIAEGFALAAVYLGTIPLWKELWKDPNTEPRIPWTLFLFGVFFELAGEGEPRQWSLLAVFPLFGFMIQQLSVLMLGLRRKPGPMIG